MKQSTVEREDTGPCFAQEMLILGGMFHASCSMPLFFVQLTPGAWLAKGTFFLIHVLL
jgi:hypothetical protein